MDLATIYGRQRNSILEILITTSYKGLDSSTGRMVDSIRAILIKIRSMDTESIHTKMEALSNVPGTGTSNTDSVYTWTNIRRESMRHGIWVRKLRHSQTLKLKISSKEIWTARLSLAQTTSNGTRYKRSQRNFSTLQVSSWKNLPNLRTSS